MHVSSLRRGARTIGLLAAAALTTTLLAAQSGAEASQPFSAAPAPHKAKVITVKVDPRLFGVHDKHRTSLSRPGTGSIRLWDSGTTWASIQPSAGTFNWSVLDQFVNEAFDNGTEVTYVVGMTPTWAKDPSATLTDGTEAPDPAAFAAFLSAMMNHYKNWEGSGRPGITNYQIWNEANIKTFWTGTNVQMAELVQIASDARAAVDPSVKLVGPAQVSSQAWMRPWTKDFYALSVGGKPVWKYLDAISLQLYPVETYKTATGTHAGSPEDSMDILATMRHLLAKDGVPSTMPIWNTEINYGLRFGPDRGTAAAPIPERLQIAYVMRTYLLNAARGVRRVYWYAYDMGDLPPASGGAPMGNTLLTDPTQQATGPLTPAGVALARVESWMKGTLVGTTTKRPCIADSHGTYTCRIRYATGVGRIYWNPYATGKVRLAASATRKVNEYGTSTRVRGGSVLKVNYAPVLVRSKS